MYVTNLDDFKILDTSKKIAFLSSGFDTSILSLKERELNGLLRGIILSTLESSYVRKKALELFVGCVISDRLKSRHALSLLIDDWSDDFEEVFLETLRIKQLFLFFHFDENAVEEAVKSYLCLDESEVCSEANYCLGLIYLQRAFSGLTESAVKNNLAESYRHFHASSTLIENRIDAQIYMITIEVLTDLFSQTLGATQEKLEKISLLLFGYEVFSFDKNFEYPQVGYYRALNSLVFMKEMKPDKWLDFREGFQELFLQFSEIQNIELRKELNQKNFSTLFKNCLETNFVDPYFVLNFRANLNRVEQRLSELDDADPAKILLKHVHAVASDPQKKNLEIELERQLVHAFGEIKRPEIQNALAKLPASDQNGEILNVILGLLNPSVKQALDKLITACLKMQGLILYRGGAAENDRNKFVANLLESGGYLNKDQTQWSISHEGKMPGEIDIFLVDTDGKPYIIVEALNLDSLRADYVDLHIDKIFKYDVNGLENNVILVYSEAKKFNPLWERYVKYIKEHQYPYAFKSFEELAEYKYANLKVGKAKHNREGQEVFLYHIFVDLQEQV